MYPSPHYSLHPNASDLLCCGLWELGIEQGGAASLGALLPTRATAQQAEVVMPIDLAYGEIGLARTTKQVNKPKNVR